MLFLELDNLLVVPFDFVIQELFRPLGAVPCTVFLTLIKTENSHSLCLCSDTKRTIIPITNNLQSVQCTIWLIVDLGSVDRKTCCQNGVMHGNQMQMNPLDLSHILQGCIEMDNNWQQETWLAQNHLAPVMPELYEEKRIVQSRDKYRRTVAALCPIENEEDQVSKSRYHPYAKSTYSYATKWN